MEAKTPGSNSTMQDAECSEAAGGDANGVPATLTAKQVELILATWQLIKKDVTLEVAGVILFKK